MLPQDINDLMEAGLLQLKNQYVGQTLTEQLEEELTLRGVRIQKSGCYTMEYCFGRVNVVVDEHNVITEVYSG